MKRRAVLVLVALAAALVAVQPGFAHEGGKAEPRIAAGISEGAGLVRTITVRLTDLDSGDPVEGAEVTTSASMTSPHVMRTAEWPLEENSPGVYRARVRFPMPAEWRLDIRVGGEDVVAASSTFNVEVTREASTETSAPTPEPADAGSGLPAEETDGEVLTVLPTELEDTISERDAWTMTVLWLHGIAAVGWILGVLVMAVALSTGVLAGGFRARLASGYRSWGAWVHWGLVPVIVITGVYNMLYVTPFPIAWKPAQLSALASVPYGPLYEAILVVKLGLFVALLVTGTQVLLRTVRPAAASKPLAAGPARTMLASLGPPGVLYLASVPLILGAAVALRYVHILSHVADVLQAQGAP